MTVEELMGVLDAQTESEFVDRQLLGRRPWIFGDDEPFDAWRALVSQVLGIMPDNIRIVGSAATGYSLSPLKPGRPFRESSTLGDAPSDIDIALIDPGLFMAAWNEIVRRDRTHSLRGTDDTRDKIRLDIYHGLIGQQVLPRNTEPARMLLTAISTAGRSPPLRAYRIRSRLYRRMEDLRAYHVNSLRQLRVRLAGESRVRYP